MIAGKGLTALATDLASTARAALRGRPGRPDSVHHRGLRRRARPRDAEREPGEVLIARPRSAATSRRGSRRASACRRSADVMELRVEGDKPRRLAPRLLRQGPRGGGPRRREAASRRPGRTCSPPSAGRRPEPRVETLEVGDVSAATRRSSSRGVRVEGGARLGSGHHRLRGPRPKEAEAFRTSTTSRRCSAPRSARRARSSTSAGASTGTRSGRPARP